MSTPALAHDIVFTSYPAASAQKLGVKCSHAFIALDLKTGKVLWHRWIDSDVMSAPVAIGDEVCCTSLAGTVYRFKQRDGTVIAAYRARATSAPVVYAGQMFWTQRADEKDKVLEGLVRADLANQQLHRFNDKEAPYIDARIQTLSHLNYLATQLDAGNGFAGGPPVSANAMAAFGNIGQSTVSALQMFQGSRMLVQNNHTYNCMGDELVRTRLDNQSTVWRKKLQGDLARDGGHFGAPPILVGGQLIVSTLQGDVLVFDPCSGEVRGTFSTGSPIRCQPIAVHGHIYVSTQDGRLVCIRTNNPQLTGWFTWGANMAHTNSTTE